MRKKLVMTALCVTLYGVCAAGLTGCGAKEADASEGTRNTVEARDTRESEETKESESTEKPENTEEPEATAEPDDTDDPKSNAELLDDNTIYFVLIDGQKFSAGDKITDLSSVGYNIDPRGEDEELDNNMYSIGGGHIVDENGYLLFNVKPLNNTGSTIKISETVIGGVNFSSNYVERDERIADFEVYGGIKLGATEEEVKAVFGEPSRVLEYDSGKTYYYTSSQTYRSFTFEFDTEGNVKGIEWTNLVYNY